MANEENEDLQESQESIPEFDERPAGNKDLWLFLIVLDLIILCVFGFFIYKHFSTRVFEPKPIAMETTVEEEPAELVMVEKEVVQEVLPVNEGVPTKVEPVKAEPVKPAPIVVPEETQPIVSVAQNPEMLETKESILVEPSKGKYRQVTFRWFGEGKKVEIVSGFTMAKPRALKKVGDHWEITLGIGPGTYKFLYVIDGKNTRDPYAPEQDGRSIVEVK